jgi:hypothetical protein
LSLLITLFKKITDATCTDHKEAGIGQQMAMASDYNAQKPMQCLTGKEQKAKGK